MSAIISSNILQLLGRYSKRRAIDRGEEVCPANISANASCARLFPLLSQ